MTKKENFIKREKEHSEDCRELPTDQLSLLRRPCNGRKYGSQEGQFQAFREVTRGRRIQE